MPNRAILLVLCGLFLTQAAEGVSTRAWTTATYKDFDEGQAEHALITSLGEVMPGQKTDKIDLEADAVWTAVRASDGTVYTAGVSDGLVVAVRGGKRKELANFDKETPWLGALALGADGKLYVGTLVSATIYAVDPKTGKSDKVVKLDGPEHIWALTFDASGKTLYAGTGPNGKLFAIDVAKKSAKPILDIEEDHILCVTRAGDGALWLGTSNEAMLFRYDPKQSAARAIADFAGTEVKAILEVEGGFVVATNEFTGGATTTSAAKGPKGAAAKPPEAGTKPGADATAKPLPPRPGERKGKGALFHVEPDGRMEQLHALADGYFTALALGNDRSVYAASGANGRIYQVRPDRTVVTAFDVEERQVNALMVGKDHFAFATGDAASLYVAKGPASDATYTSKVFDAQVVSRWGNIRWRGDDDVLIETRSGNTSKPDRGWSAWLKPTQIARAGGGAQTGHIASPSGRYLQYRVSWKSPVKGALREVVAYYLPQNQRARITEVTVGDTAEPSKRPAVTTQTGAAKPRSPVIKLKWKVENSDEDELLYRLEVKGEADGDWRAVPTGEAPLTKTEFEWNTEALPDGYYRLRVTATDARVNPQELSLDDGFITPPFLIDNLKPQVTGLEVKPPYASARALDSFSRVDEIAYSVDGGEWMIAFPKDGIFDNISEMFTVKLPEDLKPGLHSLQIRVADEADNIGAASVTFRVGPTGR